MFLAHICRNGYKTVGADGTENGAGIHSDLTKMTARIWIYKKDWDNVFSWWINTWLCIGKQADDETP